MSPAHVRSIEDSPPILADGDTLAFNTTLFGYPATLLYTFSRGQLVRGAYLIDSPNDVEDVAAHERIREKLTEKYGTSRPQADWKDPRYPLWPETYGAMAKAIATGELKLRDFWDLDDTLITLLFTEQRDAYNAWIMLDYVSNEYLDRQATRAESDDTDLL